MNTALLIIGSNQGNIVENIRSANMYLNQSIGSIVKYSSLYQTAAWGKTNQPDFINQVIEIHTTLSPNDLLGSILTIEKKLGRIRTDAKWEERIIDIDILFYNDEIINEKHLKIPHPFLQDRKFVLVPLAEIAENMIHPVLNKSIQDLLKNCTDPLPVKKLNLLEQNA